MEINKFDGKSNFSLWQARVKDVLIQQGLIDALLCDEKPTTMEVQDWKRLQMQAVSTIRMYLADEVVIDVQILKFVNKIASAQCAEQHDQRVRVDPTETWFKNDF